MSMFLDNDDADGHSDSSISVTSTVQSENDEDQVYLVEDILAEKPDDGPDRGPGPFYLVMWEGYPLNRATWEPTASFDDKSMIDAWKEKEKARKERGEEPFDWQEFDKSAEREKQEKALRQVRREQKRNRMGWTRSRRGSKGSKASEASKQSSRASSARLADFVVGDDYISLSEDDGLLSDSEASERPKRTRKKDRMREKISERKQEPERAKLRERKERERQRMEKENERKSRQKERIAPVASKMNLAGYKISKKRRSSPTPEPKKPAPRGTARRTAPVSTVKYPNLSTQNRANKRARAEPAPANPDQLELFHPSSVPRRPFLPQQVRRAPINEATYQAPASYTEQAPTGAYPVGEPSRSQLLVGKSAIPQKRDRDSPPLTARDPIRDISPPHKRNALDSVWTPGWAVESSFDTPMTDFNNVVNERAPVLECDLEYGPSLNILEIVRNVKFVGFSAEFMSMVETRQLRSLWISKSLENSYIKDYFVPQLGQPLEYADIEIPQDDYQPLVGALAIFHGAGVVLHEDFTLLVFQPSNDVLRGALKPPQQRRKTPLRAVAYPPLEVNRLVNQSSLRKPFDDGFRHYLPNLLHRLLGMNYPELMATDKPANCFFYAPSSGKGERFELEAALRSYGHRLQKVDELKSLHPVKTQNVRIFVHQSLRYQMHILPHIAIAQKLPNVAFYFFGTNIERGGDPAGPTLRVESSRFWVFGSIILLTPEFIITGGKDLDFILKYQGRKAGSTWLCITTNLQSRVEEALLKADEKSKDRLTNAAKVVYSLQDRIKPVDVSELPIEEPVEGNEFETILDAFVLYQAKQCAVYRRFIIAHSKEEKTPSVQAGLYSSIEFYDQETVGELAYK